MPIGRTQNEFILLWAVAAIWLPLSVSVWSKLIPLPDMPPTLTTRWDIYLLGFLSDVGLVLTALTQYLLLIGRRFRPWLWLIGGAAAFVVEGALKYALFEIAIALPGPAKDLLYYALPIVAAGLAMAFTQAFVMSAWQLSGLSWFVLSFSAFMAGFGLLIIVDNVMIALVPQPLEDRSLIRGVFGMLALWGVFGAVTGWNMWRRLNSAERSALTAA